MVKQVWQARYREYFVSIEDLLEFDRSTSDHASHRSSTVAIAMRRNPKSIPNKALTVGVTDVIGVESASGAAQSAAILAVSVDNGNFDSVREILARSPL
ncbi:hypothetical protein [Roseiconus lacunae]|uniref:hypothetical protein n=1 Tax=Roseiconus lacunae TaxID=2605694 RepID=UPI001E5A8F9B|nr:hypothetical protein [Roseiconus lacunae]